MSDDEIYVDEQWLRDTVKGISECLETAGLVTLQVRDKLCLMKGAVTVRKPITRGNMREAMRALGFELKGTP